MHTYEGVRELFRRYAETSYGACKFGNIVIYVIYLVYFRRDHINMEASRLLSVTISPDDWNGRNLLN
jgi:hypothetical protein